MVRNYQKKKTVRYSESDLKNAVNDVRQGSKFRQASQKWNVPLSVISNRISGRKNECKPLKCGRNPVFSIEIEEQFVDCILARAAIGYPVSKKEFIGLVAEYIKNNDIANPFRDGIPAYPGTDFATSDNGWMEESIYYSWMTKTFIPFIKSLREKNNEPDKSAILIFDGHSSHISLRILLAAKENNIHLLRLPSHLTDLLQPLDKTVFSALKRAWDEALVDFGKKNIGLANMTVSKYDFVKMLSTVWKTSLTAENIKSGFECCGLHPVNREKFPKDKFDPLELKRYEQLTVAASSNPKNAKVTSPGKFKSNSRPLELNITTDNDENRPENNSTFTSPSNSNTSSSVLSLSDDSPLDLTISVKPRSKEITISTKNVVRIFCEALKEKNSERPLAAKNTTSAPRLNSKYGEVVTGEEVISRIRNIEAEREKKRSEIENRKRIREEKKDAKKSCKKLKLDSKVTKTKVTVQKMKKKATDDVKIERKPKEVKVGQWLAVRVGEEPTWRYFVAQLIKARNGKLLGNFLRPAFTKTHFGFVYKYPAVEDKYAIKFPDILASLPDPLPYGRGLLRFSVHATHLSKF